MTRLPTDRSDRSAPVAGIAIDPGERLAVVRLEGAVSGTDILNVARTLHADPDWTDGFDVIWDCSRVTGHVVFPEEVGPLIDEEIRAGDGYDALIENPRLGDHLLSTMLTVLIRRRGKPASLHTSMEDALAAMGRDALPAALEA